MNAHALTALHGVQLGQVTDNVDPDDRGRVKVRLIALGMELWANVIAPSAGRNYGASFVPRVNEIVVLVFVSPEFPLVLGSVWSGGSSRPEDADPQEEHYVIRTPEATVLDFNDGRSSGPSVKLKTRSGYHVTVSEGNGGEIVVERGEQSVKLSPSGIDVRTSGSINVDASSITVNASTVTVNAGMSRFSGVVQADTVIATSVVGSSYTPGAGNIW